MKYSLTFFILFFIAHSLSAVNVTFTVNMSAQTVSPQGVHIAGGFDANGSTGIPWDPSAYTMSTSGNGYFTFTLNLNPGFYEYKFINGNSWGSDEAVPVGAQVGGGNSNRWVYVDGPTVVDTVAFGGMADIGMHGVLLQVDMAIQTVSPLGVHVAGDFQFWNTSSTRMWNPDGGTIYKHLLQVVPGQSIEFKFINGNMWGDDENVPPGCAQNNNRYLNNITGDSIYPEVCFGSCASCMGALVTFQVDMSNQAVSQNGVHIAGSFQGWDPGATLMNPIGNGIYEVQIGLQRQAYQFKFINGNSWGSEESVPSACIRFGNREIIVSSDTVYKVCFAECSWPCTVFPDTSSITFGVKISDTVFVPQDPDSGGVWIMGSFTNPQWQMGAIQLIDPDGDSIYTYTAELGGSPVIEYKYVLGKPNTLLGIAENHDFLSDGCGISNPVSTPNRLFVRTESDTLVAHYWNSCDTADTGQVIVSDNSFSTSNFLVQLYPNPSNGKTNLEFSRAANYVIRVYDLSGKMVERISARNNLITIDTEDYTQGMYIVDIRDENNDQLQLKLVVQ